MSIHHDLNPFDYIIGFATVAALISVADVTDILRLIILIITVIGATIKLVEQYFKSESAMSQLYQKISNLWKKLTTKKPK